MPAAISAYNNKPAADPSADAAAIFRQVRCVTYKVAVPVSVADVQCFQDSHDKFPETLGIDMCALSSITTHNTR
jgi:hypothetical protein